MVTVTTWCNGCYGSSFRTSQVGVTGEELGGVSQVALTGGKFVLVTGGVLLLKI